MAEKFKFYLAETIKWLCLWLAGSKINYLTNRCFKVTGILLRCSEDCLPAYCCDVGRGRFIPTWNQQLFLCITEIAHVKYMMGILMGPCKLKSKYHDMKFNDHQPNRFYSQKYTYLRAKFWIIHNKKCALLNPTHLLTKPTEWVLFTRYYWMAKLGKCCLLLRKRLPQSCLPSLRSASVQFCSIQLQPPISLKLLLFMHFPTHTPLLSRLHNEDRMCCAWSQGRSVLPWMHFSFANIITQRRLTKLEKLFSLLSNVLLK